MRFFSSAGNCNIASLRLIFVAEYSNRGFTEENHRVAERDEDERTDNQYPGSDFWAFQVDGIEIKKISRLCELCVSAVNIRS
jgi:hypothetical protein